MTEENLKFIRRRRSAMGQEASKNYSAVGDDDDQTKLNGRKVNLGLDELDLQGDEEEDFELLRSNDDDLDDQSDEDDLFVIERDADHQNETFLLITLQIFFPFLVAGLGMVAAGLVLDRVQHWQVFVIVNELFILVPALLGLKGNLEMTLASRLSTHANLGRLDSKKKARNMIVANLALVQCQAIVVGFLASLFAVLIGWLQHGGTFHWDHGLLLCASSLLTASVASFVLGLVMVIVILTARRMKVNPDNVATPIAAALGDLTTLALLASVSTFLFDLVEEHSWVAGIIILAYVILVPLCVRIAAKNSTTHDVLYTGWTPVLLAMAMSSMGGVILDRAVVVFKGIAVYQPVMNGVGGNLAAVQASRISTHLHRGAPGLGELPEDDQEVCISPWGVFFGKSVHARTAKVLQMLVLPGHLIFVYTISILQAGHTSPTFVFIAVYLSAASIQVWILLHTAHWLIHWMWRRSIDPDNSAIPYLTALGDLLGGALLFAAFAFLSVVGDGDEDVGE